MSIKSSLNKVSNIRVLLLIFLIITKRECWPVFKQDPAFPVPKAGQKLAVLLREKQFEDVSGEFS